MSTPHLSAPVVIIGGGIVGACTAWFLREAAREVVVVERDPSYRHASTTLSAASIRTQFSLPVNVRLSLFGASFLEGIHARAEGGIGLVRRGYLIVAGRDGAGQLRANHAMQTEEGASVALLTPREAQARFPWLRTDDLEAITWGERHEGWFDAHALLRQVRREAIAKGARFLHDEVVGIDLCGGAAVGVTTARGERIAASHVVIAAGANAGRVAALAGVALPVEPRKRTVFVLRSPLREPGMGLVFDTSGAWVRPEGEGYIGGIALPEEADPPSFGDFEPDLHLFEELLWPVLAHRIPGFEELRVAGAWAGHYEVCTLDHNAVVGPHPEIPNLILAAGFSGHGVQHAPGTGRAVAELVTQGRYETLDLSVLGYERVRDGRPMPELNIY